MDVDLVSRTVRADANRPWREVEARLARSGLTLGWLPPVGGEETIGEVLGAGTPGFKSPLYGSPEENCVAVEATVNGALSKTPLVPRSAAGPDYRHLLFGTHGRHSQPTGVWMRAHAAPEISLGLRARFSEANEACLAMAQVMQRGGIPAGAVLHISALEVWWDLLFEGTSHITQARLRIAQRLLAHEGATLEQGDEALRPFTKLGKAVMAGQTPASLPWGAQLGFAAPWSTIGVAAEAALEVAPEATMAVAYPTSTGARLLASDLNEAQKLALTAAIVGAGAQPFGGHSLLHATLTAAINTIATPRPEADR